MAWTDITSEFYEEFGDYFVCAHWNNKTGGAFRAVFLTDRKAPLKDYTLMSPWPDQASFFHEMDVAQAAMDVEESLRPGISGGFRVLRLRELEAEFGHAPHPAIALVGGRAPEHLPAPEPTNRQAPTL